MAECERCPLNDPKNGFVPTQWAEGVTTLCVVGEAPGFQETAYKKPFMGPSGKLIRSVLDHHGYNPNEVMYTNACLCRPPDNATPPKAAINACRGRLLSELDATGSRDVLALGATASSVLVDDSRSISQLRVGPSKVPTKALASSSIKRVVPTWHPAYCLRTADAFPSLVGDVGKLRSEFDEPWSEPEWRATDDPTVARSLLRELRDGTSDVVVDIEVGIEKDTGFDHPNEYDLLCVGLGYAAGRAIVLGSGALADADVRAELRQFLASSEITAHNGKFDLAGLYPTLGGLKLHFDTMLASYVLDERPGNHGLKVLAVEKLGAPKYDDEIKQYIPRGGNYANIPRQILYKYNAFDVCATRSLQQLFVGALNRTRPWPYSQWPERTPRDVHDHLVAASNELMYLELNGIAVDLPYNFELGEMFEKKLAELEEKINGIVGTEINPRSPKQIKSYLEDEGIRVASTNVDTLSALLERMDSTSSPHKFVSALLLHRRQAKLNSTYVEGIRKRVYRGRVYTTYLLHGTTSGRLASRNPNLQNVVRDKAIKRQFVASQPDRVLIHCDYKQAEARVMATLAQDSYLRRVLGDSTIDIFDDLSDQIYGRGNWRKEVERVRVKALFYGLGYGREAPSIAAEFKMSLQDTYRLRDEFFGLIPEVVAWQNSVRKEVLSKGELVTPFGRRRRFHLITEHNKREVLNEALSFLPQSTASDICLSALIRLRPMLKGMGFIRLTIHDALVIECPESRRDEVSDMLKTVMVQCGRDFTDYVPFPVDVSYGKDWGSL